MNTTNETTNEVASVNVAGCTSNDDGECTMAVEVEFLDGRSIRGHGTCWPHSSEPFGQDGVGAWLEPCLYLALESGLPAREYGAALDEIQAHMLEAARECR